MGQTRTTIYFSPNNAILMQGRFDQKKSKLAVIKQAQVEIPDGAVLNGVIIDEEKLFEAFSKQASTLKKFKNAVLVIDSSHIVFRLSVMPRVSRKETLVLVKNEFINRNMTDKEYVYDYACLNARHLNKKQRFVMSCAVDRTIIDTYKAFFRRIGIKLVTVEFSAHVLLKLLSDSADVFNNKNTLICVVDYYIVTLINLLSNGEVFYHRARILSTEPGAAYFSEISNIIYSNQRARAAVNRNEKTECIYILDSNVYAPDEYDAAARQLDFTDIRMGFNHIMQTPGLSKTVADRFVYNLCATSVSRSSAINFLNYRIKKKLNKRALAISLASVLGLGILSACGLYLYNTYAKTAEMQREIDRINEWLSGPEASAVAAEYQALAEQYAIVSETLTAYDDYDAQVSETAIMKKEVVLAAIETFENKALINHISFDAEAKTLTFDCVTVNPEDISFYVSRLRATGLFIEIGYMRYSSVNANNNNAFEYRLVCLVKERKADE